MSALESAQAEAENLAAFEAACVAAKALKPSTTDQLRLYGLFKQGRSGDVNVSKPYAWDVAGSAKWKAWKSRSGMSKAEAMLAYVSTVEELGGEAPKAGGAKKDTEDEAEAEASARIGGKSVSTMAGAYDEATAARLATDSDYVPSALLRAASAGDCAKVRAALAAPDVDVSQADDCGRNALHWAADVGCADACEALVAAGARVDTRDEGGLTALAYAVTCDHADVAEVLCKAGADPTVADEDGDTPLSTASAAMKALILAHANQ